MKPFRFLLTAMTAAGIVFSLLFATSCRESRKIRIGVSQCSSDDWRSKMNEEIEREVMFHNNVEVEIRSADDSNSRQIADLDYFADNGFDIIIVAPNESEAITPTVDSIMARGIPVVVFDRDVTGTNYTAFQGADNDSIGMQAATYARRLVEGPMRIISICGNPASSPAKGRFDGFKKAISGYPDAEIVAGASGFWNYRDAYRVADSMLRLHPDVNIIYAHNDRMAIAAADAAAKAGLDPAVIGVDAAPDIGIKSVSEGKIDVTFIYPTEGHRLVRLALAIVNGEPYEKKVLLQSSSAVDKSNADILLLQDSSMREETSKMVVLKSEVDKYWSKHNAQTMFLYVLLALFLLLLTLLFLFLRAFWQKKQQQQLLEEKTRELEVQRDQEKMLNECLNEATQAKLSFFTNVSHDLRTPLTLISEPVKQLGEASNLTPRQQTLVRIANKNIKVLHRLINQVLDFRKFESGKTPLVLTEVFICHLVEEWTETFNAVALARHIKLGLDIRCEPEAHVALDVEKIERVFFNLLSNAFKYTPDNGRITVSLSLDDENLVISVADTGRGISAEDLPNIFERFFQVDKIYPNGSGIGLALAKSFVELHEGTLRAESEPDKGSVFTVTIPVKHITAEGENVASTITAGDVKDELTRVDRITPFPGADPQMEENDSLPLLLVVDDNADILTLISELMADSYRVITAPNGAEGVRMAAKYVPDLVVCDVMMPVMDGMECCRRIKDEISTSHIPVLMLTACSMDEERVQGYESGADGYVSKPFNSDVLRSRCANLIANRRRILDLYTLSGNPAAVTAPATDAGEGKLPPDAGHRQPTRLPLGEIDNDFYNRFLEIFRERMSDADISVDTLAGEMGLGRSQFYRKIKALTNFSPVELIRNIRLKEARNMLLTTEKTISEIAYGVGFSTPAYFTKCYRETFGETPRDTRLNLTSPAR